jgi:coenzyme F420-reducing hydrogenase gamma subunit
MRENNCLLMERGEICCGPLTAAGCNARCPDLRVPCVGCRGPVADANVDSALTMFAERGFDRQSIATRLRTFAPLEAAQ